MRIVNLLRSAVAAAILAALLPISASGASLTAEDFVHAEGTQIIGTDGEPLLIKGMALGNSVYTSPYAYCENHHTEDTYRELADLGFNCVRFYLNYELLEQDSQPYVYSEEGFRILDENVRWAKKYGIGIIFNMHYPQGGYQSQGNGMELWTVPENGERLTALWRAIAERYADEPTVWGYGLINEPVVPYLANNEKTVAQCRDLMNDITDAIRSVSPYQAIFAETGITAKDTSTGERVSLSTEDGEVMYFTLDDDNVIYEFHFYLPFFFTHQNAEWAGTYGTSLSYPSDEIASADYESYWVSCISANEVSRDSSGWRRFETPAVSATDEYNIALAVVAANQGGTSVGYIDDLRLIEIAPDGSERVLIEHSFDSSVDMSAWSSDGTGYAEHSTLFGGCLKIGGAEEWFNVNSRHYAMREGYRYKVSGKMWGEGAAIRIDFAKATDIYLMDRDYLEAAFQPYIEFSEENGAPLYLGEFGVISHGFEDGKNGEGWAADVIDLCYKYGVGFNYHAYHEPAFGLYQSDAGVLPAEKDINTALREVFREKLGSAPDGEGYHSTVMLQRLIEWIRGIFTATM